MPLSTGKYYNLEKTPYHRVMSKFRYNFQCPFFKIIKSYIHCKYRYNKPHPCNLKPRLGLPVLGTLPWAPRPTCTYWSSVVTTDCPVDPQSELGPEILAQATYQELAWMGIGSSNSIAYFSLEQNQWKFAWFIEMYMYNEINPFCKIRIFFHYYFFSLMKFTSLQKFICFNWVSIWKTFSKNYRMYKYLAPHSNATSSVSPISSPSPSLSPPSGPRSNNWKSLTTF